MPTSFNFSIALLTWFDQYGRFDLPWQQEPNPYRTWVSEIMLQQTQVDTVIPYFDRFMTQFPTVSDLANAHIDEVLHLWTGLGYYARARNLHKCAQTICVQHNGKLPKQLTALVLLPGIGPSTAAAISSLAFNQPDAILDGNVKRVLSRFFGIEGWPGIKKIEQQLWQHAKRLMPSTRCKDYTQAIMDLGATLCTRNKPKCQDCPLKTHCVALDTDQVATIPHAKPRKAKPTKYWKMLLIYNNKGEVLLEQRPATGIWGGLWSLPQLESTQCAKNEALKYMTSIEKTYTRTTVKHVFTHFTLMIEPIEFWPHTESHPKFCTPTTQQIMESNTSLWYNPLQPKQIGLAAPVKKLLHG